MLGAVFTNTRFLKTFSLECFEGWESLKAGTVCLVLSFFLTITRSGNRGDTEPDSEGIGGGDPGLIGIDESRDGMAVATVAVGTGNNREDHSPQTGGEKLLVCWG